MLARSMIFVQWWVITEMMRSAPVASEEARRLVLPGGWGVPKKRSVIFTCIATGAFNTPAISSHLTKNMNAPAVDKRNGDR